MSAEGTSSVQPISKSMLPPIFAIFTIFAMLEILAISINVGRCKPTVAVANLFRIFDVEGNALII